MNDLIKQVSKKADKQLNFKKIIGGLGGAIVEFLDGKLFELALTYGIEKIPEEYHEDMKVLMEAYVSGDYSEVKTEVIVKLNKAIDVPLLDEEEEEIILNSIIGAFFKIVEKRRDQDPPIQASSVGGGGPDDDPTDPQAGGG